MPTKETLQKQLEESEAKNGRLLLTMIQVATSPSWDAKKIRSHIREAISDSMDSEDYVSDNLTVSRTKRELEPA